MPLHQISVIPAQDVTSSRVSRSKTKEKEEQVLPDTLDFHRKLPKYKMIGVIRSDPILFQSPNSLLVLVKVNVIKLSVTLLFAILKQLAAKF